VELEWTTDTASEAPRLRRKAVETWGELAEILDEIDAEARRGEPIIVELIADSGLSLGVGLGAPQSILQINMSSPRPPYYESVAGSQSVAMDEGQVFYFQGHPIEAPPEALVSKEIARAAVRLFFETGERPTNLEWREI
jgi:hypothetical protein